MGLYILYIIVFVEKLFPLDEIGIFCDDGLSVVRGNGHTLDRKRKDLIKVFQSCGLSITWEVNVKRVCFLDVVLDLDKQIYKPFHKLNSKLQYVNIGSNHPRVVLNNIPYGINRRLARISSNEECFEE